MSQPFVPRIGAVFSADIAVPEHQRELAFYSRVLTSGDNPLWREDLMNNLGIPIVGLGEQCEEYAHLPLQWMPHIHVENVAASVQSAIDLGGRVLMHNKGENAINQWAVLLDPNRAAFGIIPVVPAQTKPQAEAVPMGSIHWLDLTVSEASSIQAFYQQVVGWSMESIQMDDDGNRYIDHNMLAEDGTPLARICHERGDNLESPPVWIIYLPVDNFTESLRRVKEEGGKVIKVMQSKEGENLSAIIQDPVGVYLGLMPG